MLRENGDSNPLGQCWITRFLRRIPDLQTSKSKPIDIKRLTALTPDLISSFFEQISYLRTKYKIDPCNIYNMDETGFQRGHSRGNWVVSSKEIGPPQSPAPGVSYWVTIIECISATGSVIKSMIIHPGKRPQNNWWNISETLPDWLWAFSPKGWIDNELGLEWLKRNFIPETQNGQNRRLLILDNHESHITGEFQYKYMTAGISLIYFPSYSFYILQPLDIGPFLPLAKYYVEAVKANIDSSLLQVDRAIFNNCYTSARPQAFTR